MNDDWREDAACRDTDPEAFFPNPNQAAPLAKKLCNSCDVKETCLDWSIATRQAYGLWGGLTEQERRRLMPDEKPARTECGRGHPWPENLHMRPDGYPMCLACRRIKDQQRRAA